MTNNRKDEFRFIDATREERIAYFERAQNEARSRNARRDAEQLDASDCALSYICDGHTSQLNWWRIKLAKKDFYWVFDVLHRLDGTVVKTKEVRTRFGYRVGIVDDEGRFTGEFIDVAGHYDTDRKKENLRKKGFYWEERLRKAFCKLAGQSIVGLTVHVFPTEDDFEGLPVPEGFRCDDFEFTSPLPRNETKDYLAYYK